MMMIEGGRYEKEREDKAYGEVRKEVKLGE